MGQGAIWEENLMKNSSLYREFQAEREEVLRHKWLESEKAGYDVGFVYALTDWIVKYRSKWKMWNYVREHCLNIGAYANMNEFSSGRAAPPSTHRGEGLSDIVGLYELEQGVSRDFLHRVERPSKPVIDGAILLDHPQSNGPYAVYLRTGKKVTFTPYDGDVLKIESIGW